MKKNKVKEENVPVKCSLLNFTNLFDNISEKSELEEQTPCVNKKSGLNFG